MPKYRYLALVAAGAMVLAPGAAYASSAHAAAAHKPVLTLSKVGGKAVKKGAKVTAGLAKGTKLVATIGSGTSAGSATCSKSSITAKVTANPNSKGKATLSLTGDSISNCTISVPNFTGLTVTMKAVNLPAGVTVSPAKGGGNVTISESKSSKPIGIDALVNTGSLGAGTLTCVFTAKSISAKVSNKTNTVKVSGAKLTLNKKLSGASASLCGVVGGTAQLSVSYGPLKSGGKKVFVS
jgi:hypothetical protein